MASETLQKMEKALGKVMARPMKEVLAELQEIADSDKKNPAPHLAMATVQGFFELKRSGFQATKRRLADAQKLLGTGGRGGDDEWKFSENLFKAISSELKIVEMYKSGAKAASEADKRQLFEAQMESRKALNNMKRLLAGPIGRTRGSSLLRTVHSGLLALSQDSPSGSDNYRQGISSLSRISRGKSQVKDLAGFFLTYGYRRFGNYRQAIRVGHMLVDRNGRSPLAHNLLGSAYHFSREYKEAERYFKRAIALAPNEPYAYISHANLLEKTGKFADAKKALEKAASLDRQGELNPIISDVKSTIQVKETLGG